MSNNVQFLRIFALRFFFANEDKKIFENKDLIYGGSRSNEWMNEWMRERNVFLSSYLSLCLCSICQVLLHNVIFNQLVRIQVQILVSSSIRNQKKLSQPLKPLNVIILGQTKSDNINQMITLTGFFIRWSLINGTREMWSH